MADPILAQPIVGAPIPTGFTAVDDSVPPGFTAVDDNAPPPAGAFTKGVKAGALGLGANAARSAVALGVDSAAPTADALQASAQQDGPTVPDGEHFGSLHNALETVKYNAGNFTSGMAAGLGAGSLLGTAFKLAGGKFVPGLALGAGAVAGANEIGDTYNLATQAGADHPTARAIAGGAVSGALNLAQEILPFALAGSKRFGPLPLRIAAALLGGPAIQGGIAALQTKVKAIASGNHTQDSPEQLLNVGLDTAAGSLPFGLLGAGAQAVRGREAPVARPAPGAEAPAAEPTVEAPAAPVEPPPAPPDDISGTPGYVPPSLLPIDPNQLPATGDVPFEAGLAPKVEPQDIHKQNLTQGMALDENGQPVSPAAAVFSPHEMSEIQKRMESGTITPDEFQRAITTGAPEDTGIVRRKSGLLLSSDEAAKSPDVTPKIEVVENAGGGRRARPVEEPASEPVDAFAGVKDTATSLIDSLPWKESRKTTTTSAVHAVLDMAAKIDDPDAQRQAVQDGLARVLKGKMTKEDVPGFTEQVLKSLPEPKAAEPEAAPQDAAIPLRNRAISAITNSIRDNADTVDQEAVRKATSDYIQSIPEDHADALRADPQFVPELMQELKQTGNTRLFSRASTEQGTKLNEGERSFFEKMLDPKHNDAYDLKAEVPSIELKGDRLHVDEAHLSALQNWVEDTYTTENSPSSGGVRGVLPPSFFNHGNLFNKKIAGGYFSRAALEQRAQAERGQELIGRIRELVGKPKNLDIRLLNDSKDYAGYFDQNREKAIIAVSLKAADINGVADHEGYHYLEQNALTGADRGVVQRAFRPGQDMFNRLLGVAQHYDDANGTHIVDEIKTSAKEARAYGFQFFRAGQIEPTGVVRRVWSKMLETLERVKNAVSGMGFKSAADIFKSIEAGHYAEKGDANATDTSNLNLAPTQRLFSQAAVSDVDRTFEKGDAQHAQMINRVAMELERAGIPDNTVRELTANAWDSSKGSLHRWMEKNVNSGMKIAERSEGFANGIRVLFNHEDRKKRFIADAVERRLPSWLGLTVSGDDRNAVSNALMERTVGKFNEKAGSYDSITPGSTDYQRIRARLTDNQRTMFDQATDMVNWVLDQEFNADKATFARVLGPESPTYQKWLQNRGQQVEALKDSGYIPERRYGDYATHGYVDTPKGPLTVYYSQHGTQAEALNIVQGLKREMGAQFPEVKWEWGTKQKVKYDGSTSYLQFVDMAQRLGVDLSQTEKERLAKLTIQADSIRRNRIFRRQNIAGFSQDGQRVLAEFAVGTANKVAHSEFSSALNDALAGKKVTTTFDDNGRAQFQTDPNTSLWNLDGPMAGHYRNLIEERMNAAVQAQDSGQLSSRLRGLASLHFLGGSMAAMMVQLASLPMNAAPWMSQWHDPVTAHARVFGGLQQTLKHYGVLKDLSKLENKALHPMPGIDEIPGLRDGLIAAARDGTVSDTEIHQIMGMSRGSMLSKSPRAQAGLRAWMSPFQTAERWNRLATFIGAYKTGAELKAAGKLPAKVGSNEINNVYDFAKAATYGTQFRYDQANRPGLANNPVGALLFTFKSYPIYMMEMLDTLRKENPRAAAFGLASLFMAAGTNGLPFADDIGDVIDVISQRIFGSPFNIRRAMRNITKNASESVGLGDMSGLLSNGIVNYMTGMQFSSRIGLGDIIPGTRLGAADADYKSVVNELTGPVGSMVNGFVEGAGALSQGDFKGAAEQAAPLGVKNLVKGIDYWTKGYATDGAGRKVVDLNSWEAFMQTLGFSSAKLNDAYDNARSAKQDQAFYVQTRQQLYDKIVQGVQKGDKDQVNDAVTMMQNWNAAYPSMPMALSGAAVRKAVALGGLPLNERTFLMLPKQLRGTESEGLLDGQ